MNWIEAKGKTPKREKRESEKMERRESSQYLCHQVDAD